MQQTLAGAAPRQLRRTLHSVQRRLWWRSAAAAGLRGLAYGACLGLVLVAVALWEGYSPDWLQPLPAATALGAFVLLAGLLRRPSGSLAARLADRRLDLEDRLATALEILDGRLSSPLADRQLLDAAQVVGDRRLGEVAPLGELRPIAARSAALLIAFVSLYAVGGQFEPGGSPVATLRGQLEELVQRTGLLAQAAAQLPLLGESNELDPFAAVPPTPLLNAQTEEQLRERLARSRSQQAALSRLARSLMGTAAAREVGEHLQRGNYAQAAAALRTLARENDQLSRQAKTELSEALRQAAGETMDVSPDLARQEDRAARALAGRDYRATQQALERLSQAVAEAGQQVIPQEELAQALQRIQEERHAMGDLEFDSTGQASPGEFQFSEGQAGAFGPGLTLEEDLGMNGPSGSPSANVGSYNPNARPTRLNVAGKEVQVEGRPSGRGEGRGLSRSGSPAVSIKDTDETGALLEGVPQPTDPVRDTAERINVPFGHLQTVRDYFKSGERP